MITMAQKLDFCTKIGNTALLNRSIANRSDILDSITEVFNKPFTPRNIKGIARLHGKQGVEVILDTLATKLFDFFNCSSRPSCTQSNYDEFLFETCRWFVSEFNHLAIAREVSTIAFGKAQKLFNMTIKYMSCFSDSGEYENVFEFAHMPIDTYILKQLKDKLNIGSIWVYIYTDKKSGKQSLIAKYDNTAWSFLNENQYSELLYCVRESIRNGTTYNNKSWLEVEFDWWKEIA